MVFPDHGICQFNMSIKDFFLFIFAGIVGCTPASKRLGQTDNPEFPELAEQEIILKGKIAKKQFINKGGRKVDGVFDLFFDTGAKRYFIKTFKASGGLTKEELKPFYGKKVQARLILTEGSWDTDPAVDFPVQSRGGEYVIIKEILD